MLNKVELEVLGYRFKVTRRTFVVYREAYISGEAGKQGIPRRLAFDAVRGAHVRGIHIHGPHGPQYYLPSYRVFTGARPQVYGNTRGKSWPAPNDKEMWAQMIDAANLDFVKQRVTA